MTTAPLEGARYNAAVDLLTRNLPARADKPAFIDPHGEYTYAEVANRCEGFGATLLAAGLMRGERVALVLQDGIDFICAFLGAIRIGVVPIPLNTLLPATDYAHILADSGATAIVTCPPLLPVVSEAILAAQWRGQLLVAGEGGNLAEFVSASGKAEPCDTAAHDIAFWLYSSGSTGRPKGAPHRHGSIPVSAEQFSRQVLGIQETDVVFSAAKLFFAYGLGNGLTFPMYAGATAVLFPGRVTANVVEEMLEKHSVSVFCGVPTLYSSILASPLAAHFSGRSLRLCLSAGEALPSDVGHAWTRATGTEIIDGIGSTEMLHIFVSNRPGAVRYGTTGLPVPGYEIRLVGEAGEEIGPGEVGELHVRGPTMTTGYWNQPEKTRATFVGGWMRTGDKFEADADGYLIHRGRADDMLKVSGIWVSPIEVEAALVAHDAVMEAAVIGVHDSAGLVKTKAFVVLAPHVDEPPDAVAETLKQFVKARLAPHKYPRYFEFVESLPKTATGKIQRHVLREREAMIGGAQPLSNT